MTARDPSASLFTIRLFGPFDVRIDGRPLPPLRTRKGQWLLALFTLRHGRELQREWLAGILWPESPQEQALYNLRRTLSDLRQALGEQAHRLISPTAHTLCLNLDGATADVIAFDEAIKRGDRHSLEAAVQLYEGPLLEGCTEEWVPQEREMRERAYLAALQRLAAQEREQGHPEKAASYLRQAVVMDPYGESVHCELMQALAEGGNYTDAILIYRELRHRLHANLNTHPAPQTTALFQRLQQEARMRASRTQPPITPLPSSPFPPPNPPKAFPNNLPAPLTRFFGREKQLEQLQTWLTSMDTRLVTLTGPAGAGKTRLAVEAARRLADGLGGPIWFVDLAPLRDGRLLPYTLAHTLQLTLVPRSDPLEQVVSKLQEGPGLLLLDNFEHLLQMALGSAKEEEAPETDSALLVSWLLERAPRVTCLVTSRQPLQLRGEQELSVPILPIPLQGDSPERLLDYAGVALYVDRVKAVHPEFGLTEQNAEAVAALCRRLEGLPLAIEMAAALARTLSPATMLARLEKQLDLLVSHHRDVPARHQSLRATLEWSYDLLKPELRTCFARLSVFRGGFDLEAVEALCGSGALASLEALLERSLVWGEEEVGETVRYRMLESLREYAGEKLEESGERAAVEQAHAEYFLELVKKVETMLFGPKQPECLRRLEMEHDNLRAALAWCRGSEARAATGLRLATGLQWFWNVRGHLKERGTHLAYFLEAATTAPPGLRAVALLIQGRSDVDQGDYSTAERRYEEALAINRELKDQKGIASALRRMAWIANHWGDDKAAQDYHKESLTIYRELGYKNGIADVLHNMGELAYNRSDYADARTLMEESLALRQEMEERLAIVESLHGLALIVEKQGDYAIAEKLYKECLSLQEELQDRYNIGDTLRNLGNLYSCLGEFEEAASLYDQALSLLRELGHRAGEAYTLYSLGTLAARRDETASAASYYAQALVLFQEMGYRDVEAQIVGSMGELARHQGDYARAYSLFTECLNIAWEKRNRRVIAIMLENYAGLAIIAGQAERAARLFGAAQLLREALGSPIPPIDRIRYDRDVEILRAQLAKEEFVAAWDAGRQMPLEQAMAQVQYLNPHP